MNKARAAELLELSVSERIQRVEDVWDSIAAVPDAVPLTEPQKEELDRRLDSYLGRPGNS
jgi:putative addiction module component (TIGR02574 family)